MLKVTVQAIQGQAGAAGQPKAAITTRFGKPAPMTRQATAAFESRRDFTHAFQVACRNALAIIARKTVRDKGRATPGRGAAEKHVSPRRETARLYINQVVPSSLTPICDLRFQPAS